MAIDDKWGWFLDLLPDPLTDRLRCRLLLDLDRRGIVDLRQTVGRREIVGRR